jgi:UDP-N-acetyl-D-glucosamine dehydrogenase
VAKSSLSRILSEKIKKHTAAIAVVGLGYVGLPTALAFLKAGFTVLGVDKDKSKIRRLKTGKGYIPYLKDEKLIKDKRFKPTCDYGILKKADVVLICVPTPLDKNKSPDLSFVVSASGDVARNLRRGQLVILESTTYPGTTEEVMLPKLLKTGLKVNKDFFVAYSPERIDPGNKRFDFTNTPKVVGGLGQEAGILSKLLYEQITDKVFVVSSPKVAEMEKLFENIFRSVNIALANEMAILCRRLKINVWEVIEAASTKPYGFMTFYPGPGLGGHCIPLDPFYLSWKAKEVDFNTKFIELAGEINSNMPYHVVDVVIEALNRSRKSLMDANVFVLGVAYKKDIDDVRESPALKVIEILKEKGARVSYNDPYIPEIKVNGAVMRSVKVTPASLKKADCSVIVTDHSRYDYPSIARYSKAVVDTRNATKLVKGNASKIIKL